MPNFQVSVASYALFSPNAGRKGGFAGKILLSGKEEIFPTYDHINIYIIFREEGTLVTYNSNKSFFLQRISYRMCFI